MRIPTSGCRKSIFVLWELHCFYITKCKWFSVLHNEEFLYFPVYSSDITLNFESEDELHIIYIRSYSSEQISLPATIAYLIAPSHPIWIDQAVDAHAARAPTANSSTFTQTTKWWQRLAMLTNSSCLLGKMKMLVLEHFSPCSEALCQKVRTRYLARERSWPLEPEAAACCKSAGAHERSRACQWVAAAGPLPVVTVGPSRRAACQWVADSPRQVAQANFSLLAEHESPSPSRSGELLILVVLAAPPRHLFQLFQIKSIIPIIHVHINHYII